jgi:hypothetical protein
MSLHDTDTQTRADQDTAPAARDAPALTALRRKDLLELPT